VNESSQGFTSKSPRKMAGHVLLLLILAALRVVAPQWQEEADGQEPYALVTLNVAPSGYALHVFHLEAGFNAADTLEVRAVLVEDGGGGQGISVDVLQEEDRSHLSLSSQHRKAKRLLCFDATRRASNATATVIARARDGLRSAATVRVELVRASLTLTFDKWLEAEITPESPLTVLVDPVTASEVGPRDNFLLRVETAISSSGGRTDASKSVCAIVAAYAGRCPFKDEESSVRTADMWFTMLAKGALTINYER